MSQKQINQRLDIIYKSYEYLTLYGLKDFTMIGLLEYLQMSKGKFYHYFHSKDELISNLFFELSNEHININKHKFNSSNSLRKKVEILYDIYLVDNVHNKIFISLYKEFLLSYSHKDNEYVNYYNEKYKDIFSKTLCMIIEQEIKKGEIDKNSLKTINIIMATADGMMMYSCLYKEYDLSKEFSIFLDFYIKSVKIEKLK